VISVFPPNGFLIKPDSVLLIVGGWLSARFVL